MRKALSVIFIARFKKQAEYLNHIDMFFHIKSLKQAGSQSDKMWQVCHTLGQVLIGQFIIT